MCPFLVKNTVNHILPNRISNVILISFFLKVVWCVIMLFYIYAMLWTFPTQGLLVGLCKCETCVKYYSILLLILLNIWALFQIASFNLSYSLIKWCCFCFSFYIFSA